MRPALADLSPMGRVVVLATRRQPQARPWGFGYGFLAGVACMAVLVALVLNV